MTDMLAIAIDYIGRGWAVIPVPHREKGPHIDAWQSLRITAEAAPRYFNGSPMNIGIVLGEPSGGLCDLDLDCDEAVRAAPFLLPRTVTFGHRPSNPASHYVYQSDLAATSDRATIRFMGTSKHGLLEIRTGGGGAAAQTIFPGSTHTSGEPIEWEGDRCGEVTKVDGVVLLQCGARLAAAAELARNFPKEGGRHDAAHVLGGFLSRCGLSAASVACFVEAVAAASNQPPEKRIDMKRTARDGASAQNRAGFPSMAEVFGEPTAKKVAKWLRYEGGDENSASEAAAPGTTAEGFVKMRGVEKRVVTFADLNERYALLEAGGSPSAYVSRSELLPITDQDLKRRLAGEVVERSPSKFEPAFNFWTGHAKRHVYRRIVFTSREVAADVYNLYRGLGVTPREGCCERIVAHIREVICSGNEADASAMLMLIAWQMQNIGRPSRTIVCLKSERQQAGKGLFLDELMLKIYGPSGFSASQTDQVLGRFNDAVRGRSFIFLDEVLFAGDRRSADALKRLSTTSVYGIEAKGLPTIQCPIGVNIWLASNHDNAAFVEEHDARYWALNVSEHRIGDSQYFGALISEVDHGGREAFADLLLTMDVSEFVPWRDVPKDNAVKRELIVRSVNPWDARKWIEDCCHAGCLIGSRNDESGEWESWSASDEHPFHRLYGAYLEWQKSVKSRAAPEPTSAAWFGRALTAAGFGSKRQTWGMRRILPDPAKCLETLWNPPEPGPEPAEDEGEDEAEIPF